MCGFNIQSPANKKSESCGDLWCFVYMSTKEAKNIGYPCLAAMMYFDLQYA